MVKQTTETLLKPIEKDVVFREMIKDIPSTTYATFGLYNYPAKFIPQIIAHVIKDYASPSMSVFDPFAGYGTVGVVAAAYGHDYELWDLNPMLEYLHEIAIMDLKNEPNIKAIMNKLEASDYTFMPDWDNIGYWFPKEILPLLSKVWGYYHNIKNSNVKKLLLIPLLKTTRQFSYNDNQRQKLSRSPIAEKRVNKLMTDDFKLTFYKMIETNLIDLVDKLNQYKELEPKKVKSVVRSNVDITKNSLKQKRDILITSPPYLQAQEYIRNSKIDLFWLGFSSVKIKELGKKEIPYADVKPITIYSKTYEKYRNMITAPHLIKIYDRYFWGVLGALTNLQKDINSRMCLFVGSANVSSISVPIYQIFIEHFTALGWKHEATLIDKIVAKRLFSYRVNPATGKADNRMAKEYLVVLKKG